MAMDGRRRMADRIWATNHLSEYGIELEGHIPGYATPGHGLRYLLAAEGGCVTPKEARFLFRKPSPATERMVTAEIRKGNVIAYTDREGVSHVPVWQFDPRGGVFAGIPSVLETLRCKTLGSYQLRLFTFFLHPAPMLQLRTPLEALRGGDGDKVLDAAREELRF